MDVSAMSNSQIPTMVRMTEITSIFFSFFYQNLNINVKLFAFVQTCKLVSSVLSTLSLPRISLLAPDPPLPPSSPSPPPQQADALCGSCPPSGSAPQTASLWPTLPPSGPGFPAWPGQTSQPVVPCWTGQPNTSCWPATQPAQVTVPAPVTAPAQVIAPPPPAPTATLVPAPAPAVQPSCQPCWPGPQYQPLQPPPAPIQVPAPVPAVAPATNIHPSVPGWPAHPGWPYNPGQSGWPGQNPSIIPPHWLPPTSGPLVGRIQRI